MKRTLRKRTDLWELSVPLRVPVRGIWRYRTFAEAWGHLWRAGYPPGLPSEVKMAVRSAPQVRLGIDYLADVEDAVHEAFESTNDLLATRISIPKVNPAGPSELQREPPEPLTFPETPLRVPVSPKPVLSDSASLNDAARAELLPADEPKLALPATRWLSRAIALGLVLVLALLLAILFGPLSQHGTALPKVTEPISTAPPAVADPPLPRAASAASPSGKSHASIQTSEQSWITACVDGKVVFSKLFSAGSKESVDFVDYAVVRTGNAGPVEITVDGKPMGSIGPTGQVRVLELTPGTAHFLVGGEPGDCTLTKSR